MQVAVAVFPVPPLKPLAVQVGVAPFDALIVQLTEPLGVGLPVKGGCIVAVKVSCRPWFVVTEGEMDTVGVAWPTVAVFEPELPE